MDGYERKWSGSIPSSTLWGCCLFAVLLSHSSQGQIPTTSELKAESVAPNAPQMRSFEQVLNRRGNVIFRDTQLAQVIYTLSQQWDVNIVAGADVTGTVSGTFRDATLREILDSLLSVNGYGYRVNGNSLLVLKQEEIGPNNPNFRAETMLLPRNISAEALGDVLQALKVLSTPSGGQLQAVPSTNMLMVYDTPDRIQQMRGMLQNLTGTQTIPGVNVPGVSTGLGANNLTQPLAAPEDEIITLRPQFIPVAELAKGVELAVGTQANFVSIDNEEALMITGRPEALRRASCVMSQIDRPRAQVRITAYIYDVSLGETERLGFDWSQQFFSQGVDSNGIPRNMIRNDAGLLTRATPSSIVPAATPLGAATTGGGTGAAATAAAATGPQYVFRTLTSHFELNTVLQALDETKGAKLLADPHVTVVDRQTASIDIVTKIPIQQLTQTQQGGSIGTTAFEEAGIKLAVTPKIASDGTISMQVTPEFSVLTGFNNGNPVIDARRATTVVRVANQHTLVIGGLRQKTAVETIRGIPGLMDWKYVGRFFRSHNTEMRESELIVFLQPEIIDYQTTGLPREQIAIDHQRIQLARIPTSCIGPGVPDCRDPNCPHHHPRSRPNCGLPDEGLVYALGASPPIEGTFCPPNGTDVPPMSTTEQPANGSPIQMKTSSDEVSQFNPHVLPISLPSTEQGPTNDVVRPVEELPAVTPASNWSTSVKR
jgi:general secretion pathway protein D